MPHSSRRAGPSRRAIRPLSFSALPASPLLLAGLLILALPGTPALHAEPLTSLPDTILPDTILPDTIQERRTVIVRTRPARMQRARTERAPMARSWTFSLADTLPQIRLGRFFAQPGLDRSAELGIDFDGQSREAPLEGVRILGVRPSSPARESGLQAGDLIVSYQGHPLTEPLPEGEDELDPEVDPPAARFLHLTRELEPGDTVRLGIRREGQEEVRELVAQERSGLAEVIIRDTERLRAPGDFPRMEPLAFRDDTILVWPRGPGVTRGSEIIRQLLPGVHRFGVRLHDLSEELGRYFDGADGVLVLEVHDDAPLALEAGDVIVAIDGRQVDDAAHAGRILTSYRTGEELTLEIRRHGRTMTVDGVTP